MFASYLVPMIVCSPTLHQNEFKRLTYLTEKGDLSTGEEFLRAERGVPATPEAFVFLRGVASPALFLIAVMRLSNGYEDIILGRLRRLHEAKRLLHRLRRLAWRAILHRDALRSYLKSFQPVDRMKRLTCGEDDA